MTTRRLFVSALAAVASVLPLTGVYAQTAWPTKPIRLVVPFAAGGPADALARFLAIKMGPDVGQTIVVDNRGGAGGTLGATEVARATDGHTLLFSSTGAFVIVPALTPNLAYSPEKDFVAIGQAVITPSVIVVSSKSPFNSLGDLVKFAKANPGKLNFASAGSGTSTHLGAELLKKEAGIFMTHIPYRGAAPATTDIIAGIADLMAADVPAVVNFVKGGQLKALAVASPVRSPALPDVPTTAELNLKGVVSGTWYGLMAPAKTPPEVVAKVNAALNKALQNPDTIAFLRTQGAQPVGGSADEFGRFIKAEGVKWGTLAKAVGVTLD